MIYEMHVFCYFIYSAIIFVLQFAASLPDYVEKLVLLEGLVPMTTETVSLRCSRTVQYSTVHTVHRI